jgi:PLP dependent protein
MEESIERNYRAIQQRTESASARAGRDGGEILLLAVSKQQPVERIRALYDLGHRDFGASSVEGLLKKRGRLHNLFYLE